MSALTHKSCTAIASTAGRLQRKIARRRYADRLTRPLPGALSTACFMSSSAFSTACFALSSLDCCRAGRLPVRAPASPAPARPRPGLAILQGSHARFPDAAPRWRRVFLIQLFLPARILGGFEQARSRHPQIRLGVGHACRRRIDRVECHVVVERALASAIGTGCHRAQTEAAGLNLLIVFDQHALDAPGHLRRDRAPQKPARAPARSRGCNDPRTDTK